MLLLSISIPASHRFPDRPPHMRGYRATYAYKHGRDGCKKMVEYRCSRPDEKKCYWASHSKKIITGRYINKDRSKRSSNNRRGSQKNQNPGPPDRTKRIRPENTATCPILACSLLLCTHSNVILLLFPRRSKYKSNYVLFPRMVSTQGFDEHG